MPKSLPSIFKSRSCDKSLIGVILDAGVFRAWPYLEKSPDTTWLRERKKKGGMVMQGLTWNALFSFSVWHCSLGAWSRNLVVCLLAWWWYPNLAALYMPRGILVCAKKRCLSYACTYDFKNAAARMYLWIQRCRPPCVPMNSFRWMGSLSFAYVSDPCFVTTRLIVLICQPSVCLSYHPIPTGRPYFVGGTESHLSCFIRVHRYNYTILLSESNLVSRVTSPVAPWKTLS